MTRLPGAGIALPALVVPVLEQPPVVPFNKQDASQLAVELTVTTADAPEPLLSKAFAVTVPVQSLGL